MERRIVGESPWTRWSRRACTLLLYPLLLATGLLLLPALLPLALLVDGFRRRRLATTRCLLFLLMYLFYENVGLLVSAGLLLATPLLGGQGSPRWVDVHYAVEVWWATRLYRGAERIYGMRRVVEEEEGAARGPALVFVRHASVGDTMIPAVYLSGRHGLRLRYVLKRELLWDPCLDVVGNRLPNAFVRRDSSDSRAEAESVAQLLQGLGPSDGVVIYPEGTRFTPAKQRRVLKRLEERAAPALLERARRFRHVLPPRLGGALALLARNPGADAVFCAHTGFERAATFWDFWNGALHHAEIRVRLWRVPFEEIPKDEEGRTRWLLDEWEKVDDWVGASQQASAA